MRMSGQLALVLACVGAFASGCVRSQSTSCGELVCPGGTVCATYAPASLDLCVLPEQVVACEGRLDGEACDAGFRGTCAGGVCLPIGCGNGSVDDPLYARSEQCDDGDLRSHDGCSSECQLESPVWDELAFGAPEDTSQHAIVLDAARGRNVMFGGSGDFNATSETWELVDRSWRLFTSSVFTPSPRFAHGFAYDGRRQRSVMFGGRTTSTRLSDTWEWDGTMWTPRRPATAPPARSHHALAYDPIRDVTVLFGGLTDEGLEPDVPLADTWEWDGHDWQQRTDVGVPPARGKHAMTFDPVAGVIVLVGEPVAGTTDVWTYDGSSWRDASPAGPRPPSARQAALAFDAVARKIVLYGGEGSSSVTWAWDGTAWSSLSVTPAPEGLEAPAMATDASTGQVVLFGGRVDPTAQSATRTLWGWDGTRWSERAPARVPGPHAEVAAALDLHRGQVVVFGGNLGEPFETWALGASGWTELASVAPPGHASPVMIYDARRREVVLYGGESSIGQTWLWSGAAWRAVSTPGPSSQFGHAVVYDADREAVVLFGGGFGRSEFNETWSWNGSTWTQLMTTTPPAGRVDAALGHDPIQRRVILFGGAAGGQKNDETWELVGDAWQRLAPTSNPTARSGHALVWDPARRRLVLFGGTGEDHQPLTDAWEWDGGANNWIPIPTRAPSGPPRVVAVPAFDGAGILAIMPREVVGGLGALRLRWSAPGGLEGCRADDGDHDGLRGCADPDCWAVCEPECTPGTACDPVGPRCGDGACSTLESCQLCPQDCGTCPALCGDVVCAPGEVCPGDCDG